MLDVPCASKGHDGHGNHGCRGFGVEANNDAGGGTMRCIGKGYGVMNCGVGSETIRNSNAITSSVD